MNMGYATLGNVVGVGDPVPAGANGELGSGDKFGKSAKPAVKKPAQELSYSTQLPLIVYKK